MLLQAALELRSLPEGRKNVMELVPITEAQPSIVAFWPQNYNFFGK
jgi:hypothetical protein